MVMRLLVLTLKRTNVRLELGLCVDGPIVGCVGRLDAGEGRNQVGRRKDRGTHDGNNQLVKLSICTVEMRDLWYEKGFEGDKEGTEIMRGELFTFGMAPSN